MKYFALITLVLLAFLMACESENAEDLLPQQPVIKTTATADSATVFFATDIQPLIANKCATSGCHASFGNFPTLETYTQIEQNKTKANSRVIAGTMPQGGPLPQSEKELIQTWINEGAQNN
ncbi:MAG: putative membrane protein [Vicingaceae bacterium]|jgi:uncharacterized membrane protein